MTNSTVQTLISSENLSQQESYIASNNIPTSNLFNTVYITNRLDGAPSILSATLNQASVQGIVLDLTDPQFVLQFSNTNINLTVDSTLYYPYGLEPIVWTGKFTITEGTFEQFTTTVNNNFTLEGIIVTLNDSKTWGSVNESIFTICNPITDNVYTSGSTTLGELYGCAIDSSNNAYIVDNTNNEVLKITITELTEDQVYTCF